MSNIESRFDCQCTITWLIRDRPQLVDRIRSGGICQDGRQFSQIQADELSCCMYFWCLYHAVALHPIYFLSRPY